MFWERPVANFPLIWHWPHRKLCVLQFLYFCVFNCCCNNVSSKLLPSSDKGMHIQTCRLTCSFQRHDYPGIDLVSSRMRTRNLPGVGVKRCQCSWLMSLQSVSRFSRKCVNFDISQPYRSPWPVTGICLLLLSFITQESRLKITRSVRLDRQWPE